MEKGTVKYSKGNAIITMPVENYRKICGYFNTFNEAMNDLGDTMDFRLSELNAMDYLRWSLTHNLGFEKITDNYHSDYKIPDGEKMKIMGK